MAEKKSRNLLIPPQGGMWKELVLRIKLIGRLLGDSRVNPLLKILPLAGLIYWIIPLPIENMLPLIDDAAIVFISSTLFIELCPEDVVREHTRKLGSNLDIVENPDEEIIDAESVDIKED
ncbi:MAG: hypothetical protein JXA13_10715 [Anaerolineales bacterium]|nr:hypothetical protein [Anaerolineales bacterium]